MIVSQEQESQDEEAARAKEPDGLEAGAKAQTTGNS